MHNLFTQAQLNEYILQRKHAHGWPMEAFATMLLAKVLNAAIHEHPNVLRVNGQWRDGEMFKQALPVTEVTVNLDERHPTLELRVPLADYPEYESFQGRHGIDAYEANGDYMTVELWLPPKETPAEPEARFEQMRRQTRSMLSFTPAGLELYKAVVFNLNQQLEKAFSCAYPVVVRKPLVVGQPVYRHPQGELLPTLAMGTVIEVLPYVQYNSSTSVGDCMVLWLENPVEPQLLHSANVLTKTEYLEARSVLRSPGVRFSEQPEYSEFLQQLEEELRNRK